MAFHKRISAMQVGDYMSSDEIFAAQMWPWPDPMLKRDTQGSILFVNAAFLRLYGGQVQDWHGNNVNGWPAPLGGPAPNRFETRLPGPQGETVYDWLEYTLADGGALAIARDVTELLPIPDPDPAHSALPPEMPQAGYAPAFAAAPQTAAAPAQAPMPAHTYEAALETVPAEPANIPQFDIPTYEAPPVEIPTVEITQIEPPVYEAPEMQTPPQTFEAEPHAVHPEPVQVTEAVPTQTAAPLTPTDRDYERRALPLENEESVLGTNWRDAVIAKAVGNALPQSENTEAEVENAPEQDMPSQTNSDGPLRILLAEDNAINALLTRTLLEADGCHVDVVEDGALAVEAMKNQSYDMIFMDMRMPNMDGLESTRKIRALPNVPKSLPIVALTANAFDDDRNACFDSGMNDFMTKPVSAEELQDMVKQWARKDQEVAA